MAVTQAQAPQQTLPWWEALSPECYRPEREETEQDEYRRYGGQVSSKWGPRGIFSRDTERK